MKKAIARLEAKLRAAKKPDDRVDALNDLACALNHSDLKRAEELSLDAQALAKGIGYDGGIGYSLCNQAAISNIRADYESGLRKASNALKIFKEDEDETGIACALNQIGLAHYGKRNYAESEAHFRKSLKLWRSLKKTDKEAAALNNLGLVHRSKGDLKQALSFHEKGLKLIEGGGDVSLEAYLLTGIATTYRETGDYLQALSSGERALQLSTTSGDRYNESEALYGIANVYLSIGDYTQALQSFLLCLQISGEYGNGYAQVSTLHGIGVMYLRLSDFQKALDYMERSLVLVRKWGLRSFEASNLNSIAGVYFKLEQLDNALKSLEAIIEIAGQMGDLILLEGCLKNICAVHDAMGNHSKALEYCVKSLEITNEIGNKWGLVHGKITLADLLSKTSNIPEALITLDTALVEATELDSKELLSDVHQSLFMIYEQRGEPQDLQHAFQHYKAFTALKEELIGHEQQRQIDELQMRVEMERAEREKEILRLEKEKLKLDTEYKTQQLNAMAIQLSQKSELLTSLKENILYVGAGQNGNTAPVLESLVQQIEASTQSESDWKAFEEQLQFVHHDFLTDLTRRYPDLKPAELKVCAMLRTQLSTKEIANLLCVSDRAVEKLRYQVRKKLGLSGSENLVTFLAAM